MIRSEETTETRNASAQRDTAGRTGLRARIAAGFAAILVLAVGVALFAAWNVLGLSRQFDAYAEVVAESGSRPRRFKPLRLTQLPSSCATSSESDSPEAAPSASRPCAP